MSRAEGEKLSIQDVGSVVLKARWQGSDPVAELLDGSLGSAGQAQVSDDADGTVWGGIMTGSGVPHNDPAGFLPIYIRTDAVGTDDLYLFNGTTWVGPYNKGS